MLNLTRWVPVTHEETGISFEIRRLNYAESTEVGASLGQGLDEIATAAGDEASASAKADALRRAFAALPADRVGKIFEKHIRNVSGLMLDGEQVKTGAALFEVAHWRLVIFALGSLAANAHLSAPEGKASSSPSMSGTEAAGAPSDSPAPSTISAGGLTPSTAPATQAESGSSSRVA